MRTMNLLFFIYSVAALLLFNSCRKLLEIDPPNATITTDELFTTNKQAEWAIAAIYSKMINGSENYFLNRTIAERNFSSGLATIMGGLSSDEMSLGSDGTTDQSAVVQNKLTKSNSNNATLIWKSAYKVIYDATAAIEGLEASTSAALGDSVKKQLLGEALVLRAFSYFYLVNFFGDVPLVLTSDFKQTIGLPRESVARVYDQMKADLVKARPLLSLNFLVGNNERVRVNRWVAEALLARIYLYTGEYQLAINSASEVINQSNLFSIEQDLTRVFLPSSKEAIFQLKPSSEDPNFVGTTPEALVLYNVPPPGETWLPVYQLSSLLMDAFEANDKRKTTWTVSVPGADMGAKYKPNAGITNYMVIRLAEMHLIRAEAIALGTPAAKDDAIDDLNVLRRRAGVDELDKQLTAGEVKDAVAHERRVELFMEWGHRWFDLKRTGQASVLLPAITYKQPWWGNYQLLYPIPVEEIVLNNKLQQNPEYDAR